MKKIIFILFSFFLLFSTNNNLFACDKTNLDVISLVKNSNGTYTYNFFICIETKDDMTYGSHKELVFSFPASGAKILGLTPGSVSFENGITWSVSGLSTTTAKYSGARLDFVPSSPSTVKHPTNPKANQQCFNFSVTIDKDPNIGSGSKYKVQVGANGGSCIKQASNTITPCVPPVLSLTPNARCGSGVVALSVSSNVATATYSWFDVATGGTALATGTTYSPSITATKTFYVEATGGGCSSTRQPITATMTTLSPPSASSTSVCSGSTATLSPSGASGAQPYKWYTASMTVTVNPLPTVTVNSPSICSGLSATVTATPNPCYDFLLGKDF